MAHASGDGVAIVGSSSSEHVVVLRSGPGEAGSASALSLAAQLQKQGHRITIILLQDAVLVGLLESGLPSSQRLRMLVESGAACSYLADDLAMRGFGAADLAPGCVGVTYAELVDILLANGAHVSGAF